MLIGLAGPARSGKDTVGSILKTTYHAELYAFAHPIKEACKIAFGLDDEHVHGELKETPLKTYNGITPRKILQLFGTEFGREMVDFEVWIKRADLQWKNSRNPFFVVTDVRFDNEADWIRQNGGVIVRLERGDRPEVELHKSETSLTFDIRDYVIENNGTLNDLSIKVISLANQLFPSKLA